MNYNNKELDTEFMLRKKEQHINQYFSLIL